LQAVLRDLREIRAIRERPERLDLLDPLELSDPLELRERTFRFSSIHQMALVRMLMRLL